VAEQVAEGQMAWGAGDEAVPIVVPRLMAEVTKERAIGLIQLDAPPHPLSLVRLRDVDRDHSTHVTGHPLHSLGAGGWIFEELEREAVIGVLHLVGQWQSKLVERVDQPSLGDLELVPEAIVPLYREVWNGAGQTAGSAQGVGVVERERPIAD